LARNLAGATKVTSGCRSRPSRRADVGTDLPIFGGNAQSQHQHGISIAISATVTSLTGIRIFYDQEQGYRMVLATTETPWAGSATSRSRLTRTSVASSGYGRYSIRPPGDYDACIRADPSVRQCPAISSIRVPFRAVTPARAQPHGAGRGALARRERHSSWRQRPTAFQLFSGQPELRGARWRPQLLAGQPELSGTPPLLMRDTH
jgi:hypothetical protein